MARYAFGDRAERVFPAPADDDNLNDNEVEGSELLSVSDYLESITPANENDQIILTVLQDYVREDKVLTDEEAATLVLGMQSDYKNSMKYLLYARIPRLTQGQCSDANFKKWFAYPNSAREFVFFKSSHLKAMMKQRNLKASGKIDDLIQALAGTRPGIESAPPLEAKQAAIKALLSHSFQKPQKGVIREHCSMGHQLETPILNNWIKVTKDRFYPAPGLCVTSAYKVGLAGKKGEPAIKDSVDFHLHVEEIPGIDDRSCWGFEAKGRVTAATALAEVDTLNNLMRDEHIRIVDMEVNKNLAMPKERWQVLHHAYVYDYATVVHAVGDCQGELIQSTMIDFDETTKTHYKKVLSDLAEMILPWAYASNRSPVEVPNHIIEVAKHVPTINGTDTLQSTVNLWKEMCNLPLPLPPLNRILPSVHANWNQKKSGSDTTTMLMDGSLAPIPHVNPESVAVNRLVSMMFVLVHRLSQLYSAKRELEFYPSLGHYRNAATHRQTFRKTFVRSRIFFKKALETILNADADADQSTPTRRPLREKASNVVIERMDKYSFNIPGLTMKTPMKLSKKIMENTAPPEFSRLDSICQGKPFKLYNKNKKPSQMRCSYLGCNGKTSWYCTGCKQWFCMEKKVTDDMSDIPNFGVGVLKIQGKEKHFQVLCYQRKHLSIRHEE
jgi:hypothetical protein